MGVVDEHGERIRWRGHGLEAAGRRAAASEAECSALQRTQGELRAKVTALEAVLHESRAYSERVTAEGQETVLAIRADCDAKIQMVHREAGREVERAQEALESTTMNAMRSVSEAQHALACLDSWVAPHAVSTPVALVPGSSAVRSEPLGVACIIAPWNFPLFLTLGPLVAALAAGCVAVCAMAPQFFKPGTAGFGSVRSAPFTPCPKRTASMDRLNR